MAAGQGKSKLQDFVISSLQTCNYTVFLFFSQVYVNLDFTIYNNIADFVPRPKSV